jgi:ribonuclease HII
VILPPGCHLPGVRDSKKLSAARREGEFDIIRSRRSIGTTSLGPLSWA